MNKKSGKSDKINCFVIMPITTPDDLIEEGIYNDKNHFKRVYEHIIRPAIEEIGWTPIYPDTEGSEVIIANIIKQLINSEMVVCDISIYNPNVFFEAGIRTAVNKPIAYIKDDYIKKIPFDTSGIKHETYRKSLLIDEAKEDIKRLSKHFSDTFKKSKNKNLAWEKYGLNIKAEEPTTPKDPVNAKIDLVIDRLDDLEARIDEEVLTSRASRSYITRGAQIDLQGNVVEWYLQRMEFEQEIRRILQKYSIHSSSFYIDYLGGKSNKVLVYIDTKKLQKIPNLSTLSAIKVKLGEVGDKYGFNVLLQW